MSSPSAAEALLKLTATAALVGGAAGQKVSGGPGAVVGAVSAAIVAAVVGGTLLAVETASNMVASEPTNGHR